jgi:hypothetical protein
VSVTQHVEFKDEESTLEAIELTGQKLKGVPIVAQLTEAEKNHAARPPSTPTELILRKIVYELHPKTAVVHTTTLIDP